MQIMYTDFYNGTWAGAPSPIDFRAWRLVNIYETVEYEDRFIHCYQGDPTNPLSISSRTAFTRHMPQKADRMLKTAPEGADVKSWRY